MTGTTGADAEHRRQKISNLLISIKYGIKAMRDWDLENGDNDRETEVRLKMFEEIQEELNKPYHHKTAGLPSPKTRGEIDTKKELFGGDGETIENKIEELSEFAGRLRNDGDNITEAEISEMIEQANEVGAMIRTNKPA